LSARNPFSTHPRAKLRHPRGSGNGDGDVGFERVDARVGEESTHRQALDPPHGVQDGRLDGGARHRAQLRQRAGIEGGRPLHLAKNVALILLCHGREARGFSQPDVGRPSPGHAHLDFDRSGRVDATARDDERVGEWHRQRSRAQRMDAEALEAQSVQAMLSYGFSSKSSSGSLVTPAGSRTATSGGVGGVARGAS